MTSFSIILGTYGDDSWCERAQELALTTTGTQTHDDFEVVAYHGKTLASARNHAAQDANGEYLVFLDTGDYLDAQYLEAMNKAEGELRRPAIRGFNHDGFIDEEPIMFIRPASVLTRNFIVIGAAVNRARFLQVDGFGELPVLEDWDLWLKLMCFLDVEVVDVPEAIYLINDEEHERNLNPLMDLYAQRIRRKFYPYRS